MFPFHARATLACAVLAVPFLPVVVVASPAPTVPLDSLVAARPAPVPTGTLTLAHTLALARAHHPRLRAEAWRVRAASMRQREDGRLPNPGLSLDLENVGGDASPDLREATAALTQKLELGGDRGARVRLGQATGQRASAELAATAREVLAEAAERFLETWALQERVGRLAAAERLADRAIAAAAERLRAGAGPALEQARAEGVAALRRVERLRAGADLTASWQRLVASWGSADIRFDSLALAAPSRERIPPPVALEALLEEHPQRTLARAESTLEDARVREARAARVPDLELSAGVRRLGTDATTTYHVGGSIPLPIWSRSAGAIAAAEAEREAAGARAQLVALELRAQLHRAYEHYFAAQEGYDLIASRVKPRSEDVLRQLTAGYRSGRFSSLEYLDGQRGLLDAELQLIEATADAWRARLALERLLGRSLAELAEGRER